MAREWKVTTEQLVSSANIIEEKVIAYNTEWAKLYQEVQNLKSAQWEGVASDAFNNQLEGFRDDFQELADILTGYVEFLRTAADRYNATEEALRDQASSLSTGR